MQYPCPLVIKFSGQVISAHLDDTIGLHSLWAAMVSAVKENTLLAQEPAPRSRELTPRPRKRRDP